MGSALMPVEGLSPLLGSILAQIIVKGMRRNETATGSKDYKKETIETIETLRYPDIGVRVQVVYPYT